jgi:ketol-acid reductoisomerase
LCAAIESPIDGSTLDILDGTFSNDMMKDWVNNDHKLLSWREDTCYKITGR